MVSIVVLTNLGPITAETEVIGTHDALEFRGKTVAYTDLIVLGYVLTYQAYRKECLAKDEIKLRQGDRFDVKFAMV